MAMTLRQVLAMREEVGSDETQKVADAHAFLEMKRREFKKAWALLSGPSWLEVVERTSQGEDLGPIKEAAHLLQENLAVRVGVVPPHWTKWNKCIRCGGVPLEITHEGLIDGCLWCGSPEAQRVLEPLRSAAVITGELK